MNKNINFIPYNMKVNELYITSYEDKMLRGRLYNPFFGEEKPFSGTVQLLFMLEELLDSLDYPEPSVQHRAFTPVDKTRPAPAQAGQPDEKPVLASFRLSIHFRQNASWQGTLMWKEQESVANFRSVLELIKLIDSVLAPDYM